MLVTGGCGFIGSNFIRQRLTARDSSLWKLVNLDQLTYAGNAANLSGINSDARYVFAQGDIGDTALVASILRTHHINAIVHFAAESHVDRSIDSPEPFFQTNVVGTLRLLDAARRYWRGLAAVSQRQFRFLHISTDEVYGDVAGGTATTEESPYTPNSPYAASKAASDHLVRSFSRTHGLPTLTVNCSNNFGPFQFPEKLIPLVILNALEGKPIPVYGNGQQVRDWIYVIDHVDAICQILANGQVGETYNVGGGNEMTNLAVGQRICALLDAKIPRKDGTRYASQIAFVADRPGHDHRYAVNCDKLKRELGWKPFESFESGLAKTVDWYLCNRAWCDEITFNKYARERLGTAPTSI